MLWTVLALGACGVLGAAAVVYGGLYNIASTVEHTQVVHSLLETTMNASVRRRARDVVVPTSLDAPGQVLRGAACYREHCTHCHGGPGVAAEAFGMAMQPVPGSLISAARSWHARELYWITRNGIKMSGMPAWQHHLSEAELWSVVAFMQQLPTLSAAAYAEAMTKARQCSDAAPQGASGPPDDAVQRGHLALRLYGCQACHTIPGVSGPQSHVGPPLAGFARGRLIAGKLANTPENLVLWIRDPQRIDPRTAMPDQAVPQQHAEDMAAYLATLL